MENMPSPYQPSGSRPVTPFDTKNKLVLLGRWFISHGRASVLIMFGIFIVVEFCSMPIFSVERLKNENPQMSALMQIRLEDHSGLHSPYIIQKQWMPLSNVSNDLVHAILVAEDGTFFEHEGIDWYEVQESIKKDLEKRRFARGASTITQQLARNLYLSTSKDPLRKLKEIVIAKRLEAVLSKDRILEIYLNTIEWGEGIFGAEAAAMTYFGKHASEITRDEAARLAAVVSSPLRYSPNTDARFVMFRKNIVLARMEARGW
jgi:monofunctional biosynthetic peptidoglycan transglycosylase